MKNILLALLFMGSGILHAQDEFNEYKYIIVPKKFDALKKENQYQTSTLVKYLLVQKGFTAIYDDAFPEELNRNRCLGLRTVMDEVSSLFSTKLSFVFKDCNGREVFVTKMGISKEKEYKISYSEAIRDAFTSLDDIEYNFTEKKEMKVIPGKLIVETIDENTTSGQKTVLEKQVATVEEQSYKNQEPVSLVKEEDNTTSKAKGSNVLYAQEIVNGYQLVDSTPKIRMKIFKSSIPKVYLAEESGIRGLVYERAGKWFFEYYDKGKLKIEALNIKF